MTIRYWNIGGGEPEYVHDVLSVRHISSHGYEVTQSGMAVRLVIKDVERIEVTYACSCHAMRD